MAVRRSLAAGGILEIAVASPGRKLIVLIGSADTPCTIRNSRTVAERKGMIHAALEDVHDRGLVVPLAPLSGMKPTTRP